MKKEIKDNEVVNVVNCFEERISKIRSIVYHYELLDVIPDFNKKIKESNKALPFSMQVSNNRILLSYLYLISIDSKLNGYIKRFVFSLFVFIINSFYDSISTF